MKKSREYTYEAVSLWHEFDWNNISFDQFKQGLSDLFEKAQKDAYNEALEDVKNHGKVKSVKHTAIHDTRPWYENVINEESIDKLKKQ